ncbi:MAG: Holliday junction branch migration protein RuvA [Gammaproteobacteria bacterium]|nr:Holliday junction branch migration protein RuvA [Gammaproteobacteria bacterium]MDH3769269.1 Holliday junction branch migration protein RuvA [Gammaproteobacteria bacterium]
MIGSLRGRLSLKQPPTILVEVGGIGYEVQAPMSTFYQLPEIASELSLYTHLIVREDARELYGFATLDERALFRSLIRISGVGGRMALSILSGMSADEFAECVQRKDVATLTRIPGVGKKTAERLIVEMKDRLTELGVTMSAESGARPAGAQHEAYSALIALGYRAPEVTKMLRDIESAGRSAEDIIRLALQTQTSES